MDRITTLYRAEATCAAGSEMYSEHATLAEAEAAAARMRAEIDSWIETDGYPDACRAAAAYLSDDDDERKPPDMWHAQSRIMLLRYQVGDDDITHDPAAQAIVEAVIGTPLVRWPTSRCGDRAGRPMRLLFADTPVPGQWSPIPLGDSEAMLQFFLAHGLAYPDAARDARRRSRRGEHEQVVSEREQQYSRGPGLVLADAEATVQRLERELDRARAALADAEAAAAKGRERRDINVRWHAEALARRPAV